MNKLLKIAIESALEAGKLIMEVYRKDDFGVEIKDDNSPLTLADKAGHNTIVKYLSTTEIPILSEEGEHADYVERKNWKELWVVDPLDGTKEFVKRTGEFTVNIALVREHYPVLGVVLVPALNKLYYGSVGEGSWLLELGKGWESKSEKVDFKQAKQLPVSHNNKNLKIVGSVSHLSGETKDFLNLLREKYKNTEFVSVGSSLKFCLVAEGKADIYPRLGPTMEWDTAAAQAVVENAGAEVLNWQTLNRLDYNRENLLNDWFVVLGNGFTKRELVEILRKD